MNSPAFYVLTWLRSDPVFSARARSLRRQIKPSAQILQELLDEIEEAQVEVHGVDRITTAHLKFALKHL